MNEAMKDFEKLCMSRLVDKLNRGEKIETVEYQEGMYHSK